MVKMSGWGQSRLVVIRICDGVLVISRRVAPALPRVIGELRVVGRPLVFGLSCRATVRDEPEPIPVGSDCHDFPGDRFNKLAISSSKFS